MNSIERWLLLPLSIAIAATAIGLLVYARLSPDHKFPTALDQVPPGVIDEFLVGPPPDDYWPRVSQREAERLARELSERAGVRESALVHASINGTDGAAWMVSISPTETDISVPTFPCFFLDGERYEPAIKDAYTFVFIDSETADVLGAVNVLDFPDGVECKLPGQKQRVRL
jgi:hypothetical protein